MNCTRAQESLSQWMDGELPAGVESELFTHLSGCGNCRKFFKNLRTLRQEFQSTQVLGVPNSLERRIRAAYTPMTTKNRTVSRLLAGRTYSFHTVVAAALLLSLLTAVSVSYYWHRHVQPQQTIVCLTPLPEVEVVGYVVAAPSSEKGLGQ